MERGLWMARSAGVIWAVVLLWGAAQFVVLPIFALVPTVMSAFLAPGLVMAAMMGAAMLRAPEPEALRGTGLHLVLALSVWPGAAVALGGAGPGVVLCLGLSLAAARLVAWCARGGGALAAFAQMASLAPTALAGLWGVGALARAAL